MGKHSWSFIVRATHWLVAAGVVFNLFNETGYTHRVVGYACVLIVVLRVAHGLSKKSPRKSSFYLPRFTLIKQHIRAVANGRVRQQQGHNPLGMLAVYMIWLLIVLLACTGWLSRTDAYWGEDGPILAHIMFSNLLLVLVILHIAAVLIMSRLQKRNLVKAMLIAGE